MAVLLSVILFLVVFIVIELLFKEGRVKKTLKRVTICFFLIICTITIYDAFRDDIFSKRNAKELLEKNDFVLMDDFEILKNKSDYTFGNDYYQVFTLRI